MGIAFIVDGHQEKKVVQRLCPDAPVRMTNLNGKDVDLRVIARNVASFIKLLKGRHFPVCVIVDREERSDTSEQIERFLEIELRAFGVDVELIVSSPDRMLENWIIAGNPTCEDDRVLCGNRSQPADVSHGKSVMNKLMHERKLSYYETGNGVELFCKIDLKQAADRSPSLQRFYCKVRQYCPRLRFAH